jgi:hypothetical protein
LALLVGVVSAPKPGNRPINADSRGRGGFDRGLAEHRHYGVEAGLVSDPALPALVIPVGDLIGILLGHDIS